MGTTHKLVSVIVPVFNVFPWLREALDSLVLQTWRPLEILLVDDGSADGSGEICDEYARRWPDLIRVFHQDNRGLSAARNTGLQRMTGEIVSFLDPDDAFCPEMIEKTMEALQHHHADIAVCGYAVCRTGKKMAGAGRRRAEVPEREVLSSGDALRRLAQGKINQAVWNKLYVRRLWESLRFPERSKDPGDQKKNEGNGNDHSYGISTRRHHPSGPRTVLPSDRRYHRYTRFTALRPRLILLWSSSGPGRDSKGIRRCIC